MPKKFTDIPGVGKTIAQDFRDLGYITPDDLKNEDPEKMYERLKELQGPKVCRCMLYVFRCAVYAISTPDPDPHLLNWWAWKDTVKSKK